MSIDEATEIENKSMELWKAYATGKLSYEQVQAEIDYMWEKFEGPINVLRWLDNYLMLEAANQIAGKEKSQMSRDQYFRKIAQKMNKMSERKGLREWIWSAKEKFPTNLQILDAEQKQSLHKFIENMDFREFSWYMGFLCRLLSYYEDCNELSCDFAQALEANYKFLKHELMPQVYPTQANQIQKESKKRKMERANRQKCPRCQSDKMVSNGSTRWLCTQCGRQFKKKLG